MSTENLLRAQSAERLSESCYSSGVYNDSPQQLTQNGRRVRRDRRLQRNAGLENEGFEDDFLETSYRRRESPNNSDGHGLKKSTSLQQVKPEGRGSGDRRNHRNSTNQENSGFFEKVRLQRQRRSMTTGHDLRRKAFINSMKVRRTKSASYLVVSDESLEDDVSVLKESSRDQTSAWSTETPRDFTSAKQQPLQELSRSVHDTEKENSHLREYSKRLSFALEERARLIETLHVLSRSVSLNLPEPKRSRELPVHRDASRSAYSDKLRLSAERSSPSRDSSFEELDAFQSQESRRLPELPANAGRRAEQHNRGKPNASEERKERLAKGKSNSVHVLDESEEQRKKHAMEKLAEDLWRRAQIQGESFQMNETPHDSTRDKIGKMKGEAIGNRTGRDGIEKDVVRLRNIEEQRDDTERASTMAHRKAVLEKQKSFEEDENFARQERRSWPKSQCHEDEKDKVQYQVEKLTKPSQLHVGGPKERPEYHSSVENLHKNSPYPEHKSRSTPLQTKDRLLQGNPRTAWYENMLPPGELRSRNQDHNRGGSQENGEYTRGEYWGEAVKGSEQYGTDSGVRAASQEHSMSASRAQDHSMSPPRAQDHSMSPSRAQDHSMSPSRAQGHSMSPSRVQGHSMSPSRAQGHSMSPSRAQGHSMSPSRAQDHSVSPSRAQDHSMSPSRAQDHSMSSGPQQDDLRSRSDGYQKNPYDRDKVNHLDLNKNRIGKGVLDEEVASGSSSHGNGLQGDSNNHVFKQEQRNETGGKHQLPTYSSLLARMKLAENNGNYYHDDEITALADACLAAEDAKARQAVQRRAAGEAAVLRRQASNLLWKAMDLERICDQNARVRHIFFPY